MSVYQDAYRGSARTCLVADSAPFCVPLLGASLDPKPLVSLVLSKLAIVTTVPKHVPTQPENSTVCERGLYSDTPCRSLPPSDLGFMRDSGVI